MKYFTVYIIITLFTYLILLEGTTRVFDLSGHVMPDTNVNNNSLKLPNSEGIWIRGGMREIASHYKINPQGFNSLKDFSTLDESKLSIAIIGDSYIHGFHVDVENSIGRMLEAETQNDVEVHEYGQAGGNIVDFSLMFDQMIRNRYDYTFILITDKDITAKKPSFMGKGDKIKQNSVLREIYKRSSFMRYFNINHKLSLKLKEIFSFPISSNGEQKRITSNDINIAAFKEFDSTCAILYEKGRLDTTLVTPFNLPFAEVVPQYTPINHGFDGHWNLNGRKNCALAIKNYIEKQVAQ
jgi:hypothetical protein